MAAEPPTIDVLVVGDSLCSSRACDLHCLGRTAHTDVGLVDRRLNIPSAGRVHWRVTHACGLEAALRAVNGREVASDAPSSRFDVSLVRRGRASVTTTCATVRQLQNRCEAMPVIVVSDSDDEEAISKYLDCGAEEHLLRRHLLREEPDDGILWRALCYTVDRRRVADLKQRLVHIDRLVSIGSLASGVAHEINNPCAYLLANLDVMRDENARLQRFAQRLEDIARADGSNGPMRELVLGARMHQTAIDLEDIIADNITGTERIRAIVRGLGTFARSEEEELEDVDMQRVVTTACSMVENEIRHIATLTTTIQPVPFIRGAPTKLVQILTNLLLNASHAIQEVEAKKTEHRIEVECKRTGRHISLSVRDTGCGIPAHLRQRIFEPFFTTKSKAQGSGLGLALCAEMVEMHGGSIHLHTEVGAGSTFEILLPVPAPNTAKVRASRIANRPLPPTTVRRRLLLIDDDDALLRSLSRMLAPHHDVIAVRGGRQAIGLLRRDQNFDAIICDLMMPQIDAPTVYDALSQLAPQLRQRFIVCSGGAFTHRSRSFLRNSGCPLLEKPMRVGTFLRRIEDTIEAVGLGEKKGRPTGRPKLQAVEPNGVEPSTS